jgi:hypothetical protein
MVQRESDPTRVWRTDGVQLVRAAWGLLLVSRPAAAHVLLGGGPPRSTVQTRVLQVLGARHVAQAAVTIARPTRTVALAGATGDVLHAATAAVYAATGRSRRRAGLTDTALALALGAGTAAAARPRA